MDEAIKESQVFDATDKDARYIICMKSERFEGLDEDEAKAELSKVKDYYRENGINALVTFDLEFVFKL